MNKLVLTTLAVTTVAVMGLAPAFAQSRCEVRCGGYTASDDNCGDSLGYLKQVSKAEVAGVGDDNRVWVTEFCLSSELMQSDGNATYLRGTIANNDVLVAALFDKGYRPEDVIGVKMMGDDTINLLVHRFVGNGSLITGNNGPVAQVRVLK